MLDRYVRKRAAFSDTPGEVAVDIALMLLTVLFATFAVSLIVALVWSLLGAWVLLPIGGCGWAGSRLWRSIMEAFDDGDEEQAETDSRWEKRKRPPV